MEDFESGVDLINDHYEASHTEAAFSALRPTHSSNYSDWSVISS